MDQKRIDELILKNISGNASPSELQELILWLNTDEGNYLYAAQIQKTWNQALANGNNLTIESINIKNDSVKKKKSPSIKNSSFLKYAAGIILLLGITVLVYLFNIPSVNNKSEQKKSIIAHEEPKQKTKNLENITIPSIKTNQYYLIKTENNTQEIYLPDSSFVYLGQNSQINYRDYVVGSHPREAYLKGEGFFNIKHLEKGFTVKSEFIVIDVVGTIFTVNENLTKNRIEVFVQEGEIVVHSKTKLDNSIRIKAKECYYYDLDDHIFVKKGVKNITHKFKKIGKRIKNLFRRRNKTKNVSTEENSLN